MKFSVMEKKLDDVEWRLVLVEFMIVILVIAVTYICFKVHVLVAF